MITMKIAEVEATEANAVEYTRFLEDQASRNMVSKSIKNDVEAYGSNLLKRAVEAHNIEAMDASE